MGNPDVVVSGGLTCGELSQAGLCGYLDVPTCTAVQTLVEPVCGCYEWQHPLASSSSAANVGGNNNNNNDDDDYEGSVLAAPQRLSDNTAKLATGRSAHRAILHDHGGNKHNDNDTTVQNYCAVCGQDERVGNPNKLFYAGPLSTSSNDAGLASTCGALEDAGLKGNIDAAACPIVQKLAYDRCGCQSFEDRRSLQRVEIIDGCVRW